MGGSEREAARRRLPTAGAKTAAAEALGVLAAAAIGCLVLGVVASTARHWLLFDDADTVLPVLVANSVRAGQQQDWLFSSVLFLPELGQFLLLGLLGLGSRATMALNGVVNFTLLFVSIRMAAGALLPARSRRVRILVALAAFALVTLPALTDTSASRDSLELPSQLGTATYYTWTLLVIPATIALAVWSVRPGRRGGTAWGAVAALFVVTGVSVLNDPLHLIWTAAPLLALLLLAALTRRMRWRAVATPALALVIGGVGGMLGRSAFADEIGLTGFTYLHPDRAGASAGYYAALVADRAGTAGVIEMLVWLGGAVLGVVTAVGCLRELRRDARLPDAADDGSDRRVLPGVLLTAAFAGLVPLVLVIAVILGGTNAARYLAPVWLLPALALLAAVARASASRERLRRNAERHPLASSGRLAALAVAALVLVAGVPGGVLLAAGAQRVDPDLACVASWVDHSHRTGAGQYWTIRPVKALVARQSSLVQVTGNLRPYWWIVNRADFVGARVTFLVNGPGQVFTPPLTAGAQRVVQCGAYQIADFGADHPIELVQPPFT